MIQAICIKKNRDEKGNIINYVIQDCNGEYKTVTGIQIKQAIKAGQLFVVNLQIDKAGRLIDREESYRSSTIDTMSDTEKQFMNELIRGIVQETTNNLYEYGCLHNNRINELLFFCLDHAVTFDQNLSKKQSRVYRYFSNNKIELKTEKEIIEVIGKGILLKNGYLYQMCMKQILNGWLH